jgi:hypothetical protein
MTQRNRSFTALMGFLLVGCGGSGLHFWLYPEPRLAPSEEAVFIAYEGHMVQEIDGEDMALKCWARRDNPQAYSRRDVPCRMHLLPGEHTVVFFPRTTSRERATLTFHAEAGKSYGLDRSTCSLGRNETCKIEIRELGR